MSALFFLYGLSFFILGLVLFVRDVPNNIFKLNFTFRLLGVFAFLHATNEWQVMLQINRSFGVWEGLYTSGLIIGVSGLSFSILLAAGLSIWTLQDHYSKKAICVFWAGMSILWLSVFMGAIGGWWGYPVADFVGRWLLGGVGSLLLGWGFWKVGHSSFLPNQNVHPSALPGQLSTLFSLAGGALFVYGIFTFLGPKLPFFPASVVNAEMASDILGFPVQVIRTITAFVLAVSMLNCLRQFQQLDQQNMEELINIRTAQLRENEAKLKQSQKMEAIGQLTGGIAHDFNNILAVIQGNAELLQEESENISNADEAITNTILQRVASILKVTTRGAELTRNMLAFSRKQELHPQSIDMGQQIAEMIRILGRTLGETIDVKVQTDKNLWLCVVDPGQVENALLNLAINARDAMPEGGTLTIETHNVCLDDEYAAAQTELKPGNYVMLAVSDTGIGISPEDLPYVFEPFFTTKEVGKGTGLGLSMVYGFAKQSGGHINIYSEHMHGTTVRLYLPQSQGASIDPAKDIEVAPLAPVDEIIMVVEDDTDMRTLIVALLGSMGFRIREAKDGASALVSIETEGRIDLLLTDVVLSGKMNGGELAEQISKIQPDVKVLFMSGYTEDAFSGNKLLGKDVVLLQKPFRKMDLAQKIQMTLGKDI